MGNLPLFQQRCDAMMGLLFADLAHIVPYVVQRFREPRAVMD
jgi:hypothetical protein